MHAALFPDVNGLQLLATPGVIAFAIWLVNFSPAEPRSNPKWKALSLFWLVLAEALWITVGYVQDQKGLFWGTLTLLFLTLILSKRCFSYEFLGVQAVNTVILLLITLPVTDLFARLHLSSPIHGYEADPTVRQASGEPGGVNAENGRFFYSYEDARGDPNAFAIWWSRFQDELTRRLAPGCFETWRGNSPPYRLRPNGRGAFFDSSIFINSRGFRGREIAVPKGNVYRIVCLGESTVFGMTIRKDDKPWPELLERMINDRLKPPRPVEVINAGVPGWSLSSNIKRLRSDVLPLQPDLIISYHGYNGFAMIDDSLPPVWGAAPPPYPKRPLRLAAEIEYRMDLRAFARESRPSGAPRPSRPPLQTLYADGYRQLIGFARTNHIRLALANFCMAIDEHSDQKLINFYNYCGSSALYTRSGVNSVHSEIVRRLAEANPGVTFIDTHPNLNSDHHKFIDVVHFTQEGRRQLAENVFAAIRPQLEQDLASSTNSL
ncbi:MAG TPA: GDSL-type esterase/lipase family protein [Verrucomicrobiae bacterium]|jgi:lysophospholipase L1-like esterase|nr:GDSL-type esterase/lipase family protein [Verrucomicrobiae bacterium]